MKQALDVYPNYQPALDIKVDFENRAKAWETMLVADELAKRDEVEKLEDAIEKYEDVIFSIKVIVRKGRRPSGTECEVYF